MWVFLRCLAALMILCVAGPARAWVETSIQSDVATLDIAADGSAIVGHELVLRVRGGPLTGITLEGVDSDAAPLPDGTVSPLAAGQAGNATLPLLLERKDDGALRIEIDHPKGLRRGSYLFKFRYRTDLVGRDRLRVRSDRLELSWVGPRFSDGIDSARCIVRVPASRTPPRLPEAPSPAASELFDSGGTFLATLRRGADTDELEIIVPHVAKGEPVVWRAWLGAATFPTLVAQKPAAVPAPVAPEPPAGTPLFALLAALGWALVLAQTVVFKFRAHSAACLERNAAPSALVPMALPARALLAAIASAAALWLAIGTEWVTLAGALQAAAIVLCVQRSPQAKPRLRGPGRWLPLGDEEVLGAGKRRALPGAWLDATCWRGGLVFTLLVGALAVAAVFAYRRSPYHAGLLVLGSSSLIPVFFSGISASLPADPVSQPRRLLSRLKRALVAKVPSLRVVAFGRIPDADTVPDEIRLVLMPRAALPGLTAIEIAVEYEQTPAGPVTMPCLIVRAREDSPATRALPRTVVWARGRKPDERIATIRPQLPTASLLLGLALRVVRRLSREGDEPQGSRSMSCDKSWGKASSIAKATMVELPAHPM